MTYNRENQVISVKPLKRIGNFHEKELESIIKLPTERPDNLAVKIYTNIKGLFKPKRDGSSKMSTRGYQTSYKKIAKDASCCVKTAKRKVSLLENLGLISRGSTDEVKCGRLHNNTLNIFVWKETPHFILEEGLKKTPEDLEKISKLRGKKMIVENGIILPESLGKKFPHPPGKKFPHHISNTTLNTTLIDNQDNQYDQFSTYKNFSIEYVETEGAKIANTENVENSELPVAREECNVTKEYNTKTVESIETPIASDYVLGSTTETEEYEYNEANDFIDIPMEVLEPHTYEDDDEVEAEPESKSAKVKFVESPESLNGTQDITSYHRKRRTVETVGKDGKTYKSLRLEHLRLEEKMLQEAINRSNKPHYPNSRAIVIIHNILEKRPDTLIFGGRKGAINYLVKAINGENDYEYEYKHPPTQEEKALSMAEIQAEKQKAIDERYQMLLRGEVQSLSGAERYYG